MTAFARFLQNRVSKGCQNVCQKILNNCHRFNYYFNIDPCTYLHIRVLVFVYAQIYICLKKLQSSVYDSKFVCYNVNIINFIL